MTMIQIQQSSDPTVADGRLDWLLLPEFYVQLQQQLLMVWTQAIQSTECGQYRKLQALLSTTRTTVRDR
jgi:hypothetical protein